MPPIASSAPNAREFRDLPAWLFLWLPLACYLVVYICGFVLEPASYARYFIGEMSLIEIPTVFVLLAAVMIGMHATRNALAMQMRFLAVWLLLGTLGCFYFGGEEASWGQWYLRWSTPEAWQALNNQQETNLHNLETLGPLLDQLPRALLTLGALVGGMAIPLYLKLRRQSLDPSRLWYWIWPTVVAVPTALLGAVLARIDRNIGGIVGYDWPFFDMRAGELKEFMLAFFLLVYLASLATRLNQLRQAARP